MARWWWPTLALTGFGAVVGFMVGHDHPDPGLSRQGLLVIALAAAVVVLLTLHRSTGPGALARATAEYAVVALLAALLTLAGGNQPPATPTAKGESKHAATARAEASQDRPWVLRVAAGVIRAVTKAIRVVTEAAGWLVDLWRQAEAKTDRPSPPSSTTTPNGEAIAPSPTLASTSTRRHL
jgi:hypothetical protein